MLVVPYLAGILAAGWRWPDVPLLGAWIFGYLLSYYLFQAVKSRRLSRYRNQLTFYGALTAPLAVLVTAARPAVLVYAPAYAALVAVNIWFAGRRRERALINDLASVVQSCLIVLVVATIAGTPTAEVLAVYAVCLGYFGGTVLYVKTMIRERGNPAYRLWSAGYHLLALAAAAWLNPWAAALFAWLLVRAVLLPGSGLTPKHVGLIEVVNSALLLACTLVL